MERKPGCALKCGAVLRDRGGFSRLRVVIAARDRGAAEGELSGISGLEGLDGRVQLHVVGAGELFGAGASERG